MLTVLTYRMKPVLKEAVRLTTHHDAFEIIEWIHANGGKADLGWAGMNDEGEPVALRLSIFTDHGAMATEVGDWIVRGVKGEFYPVQNSKFEATYELL